MFIVLYRNANGVLRGHRYHTLYHAEQFARAMRYCSHVSEVEIIRDKIAT